MAGLDVLKHFEDGGSTGTPAPASAPAAVDVKPAATKGMPTIQGTVPLNAAATSELLRNMQSMVDQYTGPWAQFMGGINKAYATAQGPETLLRYQQQEDVRNQNVMNMRNQIGTYQAAQQQATADAARAKSFMGGAPGAAVAGGAGATGSFASLTPEDQARIMNARPEEQWGLIQEALKEQGKARMKGTFEAAGNKQEPYFVPGVGNVMMTPNQFRDLPPDIQEKIRAATHKRFGTLPSAAAPGLQGAAEKAPQVRPEGTAEDIARGLGVPLTSGTRTVERQTELYNKSLEPGYTGPKVAKPTTSKHVTGDAIDVNMKAATPEQLQALRDAGFVQRVKDEPWHWELPTAKKPAESYQVASNAPVPPPKQVPTPTVPTIKPLAKMPNPADFNSPEEYRAALDQFKESETQRRTIETEQAKKNIDIAGKSGEETRKKAGDMIAAVESNAKGADEVIKTADRVINHAMNHPKEFGYGYQQENKLLAGAANIPGIGAITEKVAPALFGAPGETNRRSQTDTDAGKLGLDFAAQMFAGTGARLGVGLETMASNAKGVGTHLPASTNALNANLVKVAAEKAKETADVWNTWKKTHGGDSADPNEFIHTAEYKDLSARWDKRLVEFDKELERKFPDVYQAYKEEPKKNRRPLGEIIPGAK